MLSKSHGHISVRLIFSCAMDVMMSQRKLRFMILEEIINNLMEMNNTAELEININQTALTLAEGLPGVFWQ